MKRFKVQKGVNAQGSGDDLAQEEDKHKNSKNKEKRQMQKIKKLTALLLALVMALSLSTMAFADGTVNTEYERPESSTPVTNTPGISSITVNTVATSFAYDDNTGTTDNSPIYARATVSGTETEYNLKTATVVITTTGSAPEVYSGETKLTTPTAVGNAYTYQLDMYNNAYKVLAGGRQYVLAAGLAKTTEPIAVPNTDPMRIIGMTIEGEPANATMNVVQNPFMGNPYYDMWTSATYTVKAEMEGTPNRAALTGSITIPDGTTAPSGSDTCLKAAVTGTGAAVPCTLNLTSTTTLKVEYGNFSRNYTVIATDDNTISISYGFDFTEAINSPEYQDEVVLDEETGYTVTNAVDDLIDMAHAYFASANEDLTATYGTITVTAGSTVMDVMHDFAEENGFGSEVPEGCTYMATLNGIGEFTFGTMSGWMYTDGPDWDDKDTNDKFYEDWNTPPIGAASYTLNAGDKICWFICCEYTHHPW